MAYCYDIKLVILCGYYTSKYFGARGSSRCARALLVFFKQDTEFLTEIPSAASALFCHGGARLSAVTGYSRERPSPVKALAVEKSPLSGMQHVCARNQHGSSLESWGLLQVPAMGRSPQLLCLPDKYLNSDPICLSLHRCR